MHLSLADLLFVAFLVLKLTGHIDWSWWLVTAPLWASFIIRIVANIAAKDKVPKPSRWQERLKQLQEEQRAARKN